MGSTDGVDAILLLVSELVTNAVVHAGPATGDRDIVLTVDRANGVVHVEVSDRDPTLPVRGEPASGDPAGRGLRLVDALASDWGVIPCDGGKVVWFEVEA